MLKKIIMIVIFGIFMLSELCAFGYTNISAVPIYVAGIRKTVAPLDTVWSTILVDTSQTIYSGRIVLISYDSCYNFVDMSGIYIGNDTTSGPDTLIFSNPWIVNNVVLYPYNCAMKIWINDTSTIPIITIGKLDIQLQSKVGRILYQSATDVACTIEVQVNNKTN